MRWNTKQSYPATLHTSVAALCGKSWGTAGDNSVTGSSSGIELPLAQPADWCKLKFGCEWKLKLRHHCTFLMTNCSFPIKFESPSSLSMTLDHMTALVYSNFDPATGCGSGKVDSRYLSRQGSIPDLLVRLCLAIPSGHAQINLAVSESIRHILDAIKGSCPSRCAR